MDQNNELRQSYADAPESVRNELVKRFERLINKITAQEFAKVDYPWAEIHSMALEGFVNAMNEYDPNKSSMTFAQYAAFAMLNNIHNRMTAECRTVRLTSYGVEQARKQGKPQFTSVRVDALFRDGADNPVPRETKMGLYEDAKFADGDVYEYLYSRIDEKFNETDRLCFYAYYGLRGYHETQVAELAAELKVTSGRVSQRIKKVVTFIKHDPELCEALGSLNS
jgi:RNA polymerase sigma factor (sigma-70 family)